MISNLESLRHFLPELLLSGGVLVILGADLVAGRPSLRRSAGLAFVTLGLALAATLLHLRGERVAQGLFGGLLAQDPLTDFFRLFFLAATALVGLSSLRARDAIDWTAGAGRARDSAELYALLLTTAVGLDLMAASTDLLTAFLSLEMVSILSYILSGFQRHNRASSEASLKYVIYGGVASGVMLYGMSFLYGLAGATSFAAIRAACASTPSTGLVVLAVILCLAGFGYKIASVPFHMWCPDVYEGAPTPVTMFLAVGPKAAGFALLIRFFGGLPAELSSGAAPWPLLLAVLACATMTLGNLAALQQTNLKRLLAYSSIAHAGYLLLGLAAGGHDGTFAILLYLITYLFMTVGAFVVITGLSEVGVGVQVADYRGLGQRAPLAALAMALFLFSLTGLPPFAGFFGKYFLFAALIAKGSTLLVTVAIIGVLNSAVSLFYYARVLKAMYFETAPDGAEPLDLPPVHSATLWLTAAPTVALCLLLSPVMTFVERSLAQWTR